MAADNKTLGNFQLTGIAPARRGIPQIEVTFDIDVNGIVHVSATDKATNKSQDITIQNSSGLTEEEIDRMVKDAEANKDADAMRKEEIELVNKAETFITQIEDTLNNKDAKIDDNQRKEVEALRDELKKAIEAKDYETLKTKLDQLEKAAQAMSEAMYKAQAEQQAQGAQGQAQPNDDKKNDDVVDADFTTKK